MYQIVKETENQINKLEALLTGIESFLIGGKNDGNNDDVQHDCLLSNMKYNADKLCRCVEKADKIKAILTSEVSEAACERPKM